MSKEWLKDIKISQELKDKIYYDKENDLWVISWNAVGQSLTELEELKAYVKEYFRTPKAGEIYKNPLTQNAIYLNIMRLVGGKDE